MESKLVFQDETEMKRLSVQNTLLSSYEEPLLDALIRGKQDVTVLDVGCNDGRKTVKRFSSPLVTHVIGLEYNEELSRKAQREYGDERFTFLHLDVERNDFALTIEESLKDKGVKQFDIIYLSFLLMHLSDAKMFLASILPFLKEDGKIFIIEADDSSSFLQGDKNNLLKEFLEILSKDKYSGNREMGKNITSTLLECGYHDIKVWHNAISAGKGEIEKKEMIFTTFFSYLAEDVKILLDSEPENDDYKAWDMWLKNNFNTLRELVLMDESEITMGMKILTAGKGGDDV